MKPEYASNGDSMFAGRRGPIRRAVDAAVTATERITDASHAESILAEGAADLVGMVRALIADPDLPDKAWRGRAEEIRACLGTLGVSRDRSLTVCR